MSFEPFGLPPIEPIRSSIVRWKCKSGRDFSNVLIARRSLPRASVRHSRRHRQWQYRGVSDHHF
jgi:hypothetical protein